MTLLQQTLAANDADVEDETLPGAAGTSRKKGIGSRVLPEIRTYLYPSGYAARSCYPDKLLNKLCEL